MDRQKLFESITEEYSGKLLAWAVKKTGNRRDGEDLSQEVLLQIFTSIARGNEIKKLENYIWRVAHFVWYNHLRKTKRASEIMPLDETVPDGRDFVADFIDRDFLESEVSRMRRRITDLSSTQRKAMILHYLDGLSVRQVAQKLDITESAVNPGSGKVIRVL